MAAAVILFCYYFISSNVVLWCGSVVTKFNHINTILMKYRMFTSFYMYDGIIFNEITVY